MAAVKPHPGEVLRKKFLAPRKMSCRRLADALDVPANRITDIVRGRRGVSADTAFRLAIHFRTKADYWLELQASHDLSVLTSEHGEEIRRRVKPGPRRSGPG